MLAHPQRYASIAVQEIRQLLGIDCLEAHIMQIIHYLFEIAYADLIIFFDLTFDDAVEHYHHHDCPGRGVVGIPLVMQVLAGILNVGMGSIQWIELIGREYRRGWELKEIAGSAWCEPPQR